MNKDHYRGDFVQLPLRHGSEYWEVDLDFITLGDQTVELDATGAIFDSGTSFIALPETLAHVMHREIGAQRGDDGKFFIDCSKRENLPDLTFNLAGHNFTLTPSAYVLQAGNDCTSLLQGLDIPSPPGPVVLLGTPFLKKWYSTFDLGKGRIGFAMAK